jgi:hypothetical protein
MTPRAELEEMLAEYRSALAAGIASMDEETSEDGEPSPADKRYDRAFQALVDARPTDPAGAAAQLRWWLAECYDGPDRDLLQHVAEVLETRAAAAA